MHVLKAYADTSGGQVHYRHVGGAGTPAVFLHQTASSGAMWLGVMRALHPSNAMYAIDTPGFGGSFDPEGPLSIARFAAWIGEAMTAIGIDACHLVGHHTGACIALELASQLTHRVASLTLIGPLPLTAEERAAFSKQFGAPFDPDTDGGYLLRAWKYLQDAGAGQPWLLNREMADTLRAHPTRSRAYGAVWSHDFKAQLAAYEGRLMMLCAPDDVLYPFFERARLLCPQADASVLAGGASFEPDLASVEIAGHLARHFAG